MKRHQINSPSAMRQETRNEMEDVWPTAPDEPEDEADCLRQPKQIEPFEQWFARRNSPPILPDY